MSMKKSMAIATMIVCATTGAKQTVEKVQKEKTEKHVSALNRLREKVEPLIQQASVQKSTDQRLAYDQEASMNQRTIIIDDSCAHCQKLFNHLGSASA